MQNSSSSSPFLSRSSDLVVVLYKSQHCTILYQLPLFLFDQSLNGPGLRDAAAADRIDVDAVWLQQQQRPEQQVPFLRLSQKLQLSGKTLPFRGTFP